MTRRRGTSDRPPPGDGPTPIRLLTAVPLCDGHDSAISTVNLEFIRHGIEVIYLGYHRSVRDVVRAAIQEDVAAVGISSYNGGHVEFFSAVVTGLRAAGAQDIAVFGGGGGTITTRDAALMKQRGIDRIFFPGESLDDMVRHVKQRFARLSRERRERVPAPTPDRQLARALTQSQQVGSAVQDVSVRRPKTFRATEPVPLVIGITGPGGAGKTTLIDELVLRFLRRGARVGILSHDPSIVGDGALLGDRATMIYSQHDQVFMRSLASRGRPGGVAPETERCLEVMKAWARVNPSLRKPAANSTGNSQLATGNSRFDVILVETVGIGQEALPFPPGAVDRTVLVMSPDYGSRLQLQKIVMLDVADIVVINKSDLSRARTASNEVDARLTANGRGQQLLSTVAKQHGDPGVDQLFKTLTAPPPEVPR